MKSSSNHGDGKALVLGATDIVALIGKTVALKKRGRNYIGLCPFHQEKTPSFNVDPTKQYYKCFGCGKAGNAIDFVIERDRVEFKDALRILAEEAGVELPRFGGASKEKASERQVLLDACATASMYFEKALGHEQFGKPARAYLASRGFNEKSIADFKIGFAPDGWDNLLRHPFMKKFTPGQLHTAGLLKSRETGQGHYDVFRNRLMFPIRDETGRTIAFGGRVMPGNDSPAKYLNSPETPLFSKSKSVFGLDLARQKIVETRVVAVVEGYTDVVMAHQYGATNVVSILGTAMTEGHVSILRRFADRIVLLFDADAAGENAVNRAVELFLTQPVEIAIASIPEDLDPDEYLLKHGTEAFEKLLSGASDALTFKWKLLASQFELSSGNLTAQQKAVEHYLETLAGARGTGAVDLIRWGQALSRVSRLTDIPVEELQRRFKTARAATRPAARQSFSGGNSGAGAEGRSSAAGRETGDAPVEDRASGDDPASDNSAPQHLKRFGPLTARDRAERWVLGALLAEPGRWHDVQQHLHPGDFQDSRARELAEIYWDHQRNEGEPAFAEFLGILQRPDLKELAIELYEEVDALSDLDAAVAGSLNHLAEAGQRLVERKLLAELRRNKSQNEGTTGGGNPDENDENPPESVASPKNPPDKGGGDGNGNRLPVAESGEVDLLRRLQEQARRPDVRRNARGA